MNPIVRKHHASAQTAAQPFGSRGLPTLLIALGALAPATLPFSAQAQSAQDQTELEAIRVTADFDPNDVRPEGVTTATRTYLAPRDIPQTIDTVEVSRSKSYGINDLSVMLDGVPGVSTAYDMRGEGVYIRGFNADNNDIYRDGIRESGQVRRSTANVERIEVLKGPASVLYGRGSGGGIINMISKQARFDAGSSVSLRGGSWHNVGGTLDLNKVLNRHVAVRLVADREQAHSFRSGMRNRNEMFSPSILVDTRTGLRWVGQYTWDTVWRVPDRGPVRSELPEGVSIRTGFARPGDYVEDKLRVLRSDLSYDFNPDWKLRWVASQRKADQNFDYVFLGTWCGADGTTRAGAACTWNNRIRQRYAWQVTENETTTNTLDLTGKLKTAGISHDLLAGIEYSEEERHPLIGTIPRAGLYRDAIDPYNPVWPTPYPAQPAANTHNLHEGKAKALYVQDLISFSEQWKLLAGLRYDQFRFHSTNLLTGTARGYKGNAMSQRLGGIWQPVKTQSLYASWSKSFAPYGGRGMMNVATASNAVFDAEPQYSRQIEVGIKSDWADGAFSTHVAVYQLEHYNIRYQPDENDPLLWAVRGRDRSRGVEFGISGRLLKNWYVRGGISFARAEVVSNAEDPGMEGKLLPNFAKRNGNLFVRYAPAGHWYGEVGLTHAGPRWEDEDNTARLPGYTRWDAMAGWRKAPWTVTLAVTNLLDKEYWRSSAMPGAPRTFLLTANYQF